MNKEIRELFPIASDDQFEKALRISRELKDKRILLIQIVLPYPWGIRISFDSDGLKITLKNKDISIGEYNDIFNQEISEMILAVITSREKNWLQSKINDLFENKSELKDKYEKSVREILSSRMSEIDKQIIDKSLKETFALRKVTKNKVISNIDWEISRKIYSEDVNDIDLPPFATLGLSFAETSTRVPHELLYLLEYGKRLDRILLDLNLYDIDMLINKLTEMREKLENISQKKE